MNVLSNLLQEKLLHAIGWTLIHSVWQGVVIALALGLILLLLQKQSAKIRYLLSVFSLGLILIVSVTTFTRIYAEKNSSVPAIQNRTHLGQNNKIAGSGFIAVDVVNDSERNTGFGIEPILKNIIEYLNLNYSLVVTIWLFGLLILFFRFFSGLVYTQRIRYYKTYPIAKEWEDRISVLKSKMAVCRPFKVLESALTKVPVVIGYFKPVILVPVGTLTGIPFNQVEAILAHELAHIKRNDYIINIFQSITEFLFFYHPAVWWMSSIIRKERENCCDDMAVSVCDESLTYINALTNLQEMKQNVTFYALALSGRKGRLFSRIKRLVEYPRSQTSSTGRFLAVLLSIFVLMAVTYTSNASIFKAKKALLTNGVETEVIPSVSGFMNNKKLIQPDFMVVDTVKKQQRKTIRTQFYDEVDQKEKDVRIVIEKGVVKKLFIDGKKIPEKDMGKYRDLIDNTLKELEEAEQEMKEAEYELEDVGEELEELEEEMERLETELEQIEETELWDFDEDLEQSLEEIGEALEDIVEFDEEEFRIDMEDVKADMEKAMQELQTIDWDKYSEEIERAEKELQEAIEEFHREQEFMNKELFEEFRKEMEKAQMEIQEVWKNFDSEEFRENIRKAQMEMLKNIKELDTVTIKKELKEAREQMKRAMEEARKIDREKIREQIEKIQENMRVLMENHKFDQQLRNEDARKALEEGRKIQEEREKEIQRSLEENRLEREKRMNEDRQKIKTLRKKD